MKDDTLKNIDVDFEKDIKSLKENQTLNILEIKKFTRLILRDIVWMLMVNNNIEVKFGYDYYMYVLCEELHSETIAAIEKLGMFVEPYVGQIEYTIVDKDGNEI